MIRDIWTYKWFIGGFGFLIVFAVLCYSCSQHDIASFQEQVSDTDDKNSQEDMSQKDVPPTETLEPVEDTSVPTQETTEKTDTFEKNTDTAANVRTSPFGFGPYPEVPDDYPHRERVQVWDDATPEQELSVRVRIKLWKQGIRTEGVMFDTDNGLIYPTIPGVLYVQWQNAEEDDPEFAGRRYASLIMGDPNTSKKWQSLYLTKEGFERTDVNHNPEVSGIKIYEYPDGGIDPYKFLDLPR